MSLKITPLTGEPMRFIVGSESKDGESYVVDLGAHYPMGACCCRDFACRRLPQWKATGFVSRCKHLRQARDYLLDAVIADIRGKHDESGE